MKIEEDLTYKTILGYIYENQKVYPDEIATMLKITRQAADYRLKKLSEHNYVRKELDLNGRVYYVLTREGYKLLGVKPKVSKHEIYDIIKYIPLLPIALGLIGLGKYIAERAFYRGLISLTLWSFLGLIIYLLFQKIFKE